MKQEVIADEEIDLEPAGYSWYEFSAKADDEVHIHAREIDDADFDLYLVHSVDCDAEGRWSELALFAGERMGRYKRDFRFKKDDDYAIVLSNWRGRSVTREIRVKVVLERTPAPSSKEARTSVELPADSKRISGRGLAVLIVLMSMVVLLGLAISTINLFLAGVVVTVIGIAAGILRDDIRTWLARL